VILYYLLIQPVNLFVLFFLLEQVHINNISPESVQAHAVQVCRLNLNSATKDDLQNVKVCKFFYFKYLTKKQQHGNMSQNLYMYNICFTVINCETV
jgi:hypothetical protein